MPILGTELEIDRCPHCRVDKPNLSSVKNFETVTYAGQNRRFWRVYVCKRCGGAITAVASSDNSLITVMYPKSIDVDESIPEKARTYLKQALDSLHSPAGSVMLSASAVDAMLKAKNYKKGTLYQRIDKAQEQHLITKEMAQWAHQIRLDANDQRHADEDVSIPTEADAQKCVDFALALGQFLFILPDRVKHGLEEASR